MGGGVVKERPILFSGPMVRAILEGRKTQTRRIVKPQPPSDLPYAYGAPDHEEWFFSNLTQDEHRKCYAGKMALAKHRYGVPGDRLWVKEAIRRDDGFDSSSYIADGAPTVADAWPWKNKALPSIHCPRGLSRIDLDVTGVRVERLHDISGDDAIAEGIEQHEDDSAIYFGPFNAGHADPREAFRWLWESINGIESWKANPFVWVIEFKRLP